MTTTLTFGLEDLRALMDACSQAAANSDPDECEDESLAPVHARFAALEDRLTRAFVQAVEA